MQGRERQDLFILRVADQSNMLGSGLESGERGTEAKVAAKGDTVHGKEAFLFLSLLPGVLRYSPHLELVHTPASKPHLPASWVCDWPGGSSWLTIY